MGSIYIGPLRDFFCKALPPPRPKHRIPSKQCLPNYPVSTYFSRKVLFIVQGLIHLAVDEIEWKFKRSTPCVCSQALAARWSVGTPGPLKSCWRRPRPMLNVYSTVYMHFLIAYTHAARRTTCVRHVCWLRRPLVDTATQTGFAQYIQPNESACTNLSRLSINFTPLECARMPFFFLWGNTEMGVRRNKKTGRVN